AHRGDRSMVELQDHERRDDPGDADDQEHPPEACCFAQRRRRVARRISGTSCNSRSRNAALHVKTPLLRCDAGRSPAILMLSEDRAAPFVAAAGARSHAEDEQGRQLTVTRAWEAAAR